MEVIVQKQKCEKPAIFNDSCAGLHVFMRAVLGKCTDLEQREPTVSGKKIGPKRIAGLYDDPDHQSSSWNMQEPISQHIPAPCAYVPNITAHEIILRNQYTDQQAPRESRVEHMHPLQPSRQSVPNGRI